MKTYFVIDTGEELQYGDTIELELTKKSSNGKQMYKYLEFEFTPENVQELLAEGIIEERKRGIVN